MVVGIFKRCCEPAQKTSFLTEVSLIKNAKKRSFSKRWQQQYSTVLEQCQGFQFFHLRSTLEVNVDIILLNELPVIRVQNTIPTQEQDLFWTIFRTEKCPHNFPSSVKLMKKYLSPNCTGILLLKATISRKILLSSEISF